MPVKIDSNWIDQIKKELPEKPFDKQRRYIKDMGLPYSITSALCPDFSLCEFFEEAASLSKDPQKNRQLGGERIIERNFFNT